MSLTLTIRSAELPPVDLTGVTPDALRGETLESIRRRRVSYGNALAAIGDWCDVGGDASAAIWRLQGDWSHIRGVGSGMQLGRLEVHGNVGARAGVGMGGGELEIHGDADDLLGAEMTGGVIRVRGEAGNLVGAALPGGRRGMNRGTILIDGNAGDDVGLRMRRGLIAVAGDVGARCGNQMLAGTIVILGRCGAHAGNAMRRGTLALLGPQPELLPTFLPACELELNAMGLVASELRANDFAADRLAALTKQVRLFRGDSRYHSRGEILMRG